MNIKAFLIVAALLAAPISSLFSQQSAPESLWSYGANGYYGAVMRYLDGQSLFSFTGLHGVELYAQKATDGSKRWHKMYRYPQVGVALSYYNFGDKDVLGKVATLTAFIDFTLIKNNKHKLKFNLGTGLVYADTPFHPVTNPLNSAISSTISYALRGTFHYETQVSDNHFLNFNVAFRHYSNGKLNMPNNGMNFPIAGVGLRFAPNRKKIKYEKDTITSFDRKIHGNIMTSMSWREVLENDTKHKAYTLSLYASKQISKYNGLLLGVDGFYYDDDNLIKAREHTDIPDDTPIDGRQLAITIGHEIFIGKLSIITQGGVYVFIPADIYASWYQRYGLKYMITKDFFLNTSLKTHSRTANLVEFGLGLKL